MTTPSEFDSLKWLVNLAFLLVMICLPLGIIVFSYCCQKGKSNYLIPQCCYCRKCTVLVLGIVSVGCFVLWYLLAFNLMLWPEMKQKLFWTETNITVTSKTYGNYECCETTGCSSCSSTTVSTSCSSMVANHKQGECDGGYHCCEYETYYYSPPIYYYYSPIITLPTTIHLIIICPLLWEEDAV